MKNKLLQVSIKNTKIKMDFYTLRMAKWKPLADCKWYDCFYSFSLFNINENLIFSLVNSLRCILDHFNKYWKASTYLSTKVA